MKTENKAILICLVGAIVMFLGFGYTVLQNNQKQYIEQNKREGLGECYQRAESLYHSNWQYACDSRDLGFDCLLPPNQAKSIQDALREANFQCQELWK